MRRLSRRISAQFEVRAAERERIARELHDTLLQGVQGLIMRFQSVADHFPAGHPMKDVSNRALDRAEQVLLDGRDRVHDLRRRDGRGLEDILRELAEQQPFEGGVQIEVNSDGALRVVQPAAQDEIVHIASEALFNAARHACARRLSIQISYGAPRLQISISDDGVGFGETATSRAAAQGHYGLIGMRERARKLGAQLAIESAPMHGTAVVLRVPAAIAYAAPPRRVWPWQARAAEPVNGV
jgi:signal transduction histidine kinase